MGRVSRMAVLMLGLAVNGAVAAEIVSLGVSTEYSSAKLSLRLAGNIVEGDAQKLKAALTDATNLNRWDKRVLELNSPGGSYIEGLMLAAEIRRNGIETTVRTGDECYSACALAFLGGAEWLRDTEIDESQLPNQLPARSIERDAIVGFHAPYLEIPESEYGAKQVQNAYRLAVDSISMLVQLANQLYVEPEELPRLLAPDANSAFVLNTVDAVRTLWVDYSDSTMLPSGRITSITPPMVSNACVNRWYHARRRSALRGYAIAQKALSDFKEGSLLLANDEAAMAFGTQSFRNGTLRNSVAYMPIAMTEDHKTFIWCIFRLDPQVPSVFYRKGGTISEVFESVNESTDLWGFEHDGGSISLGESGDHTLGIVGVMDMVPADTGLNRIGAAIRTLSDSGPNLLVSAN